MELFYSDKYFVLQDEQLSLWVNRENGVFSTKTGLEVVVNNTTLVSIGKVYGFIGILRLSSAAEPRLVFIRSQESVCNVKGHDIYKITSVVTVPVESECEIEVESILKPKQDVVHTNTETPLPPGPQTQGPQQPVETLSPSISWNKIKIPSCPNTRKYAGRFDRTEKRLSDEFHKMFIEADSFYYSFGYDIFNTLQRQTATVTLDSTDSDSGKVKQQGDAVGIVETGEKDKNQNDKPIQSSQGNHLVWENADERFMWNEYMLSELTSSEDTSLHRWAIAIMQGSVQYQECQLDPSSARVTQNDSEVPSTLDLLLISRRSRYRAGMRYLRRGVDDTGKVANYVETEQIMIFRGHMISFVQSRGSVPVFWSQPGYKYRPPMRLDKSIEESFPAFQKHIDEELGQYAKLVLVNLVEKNGKERILEDAYRKCVLLYDSENISYVTFDFHDKCRGLKFDNVNLLTESVGDIIKNMAYCWVDSYGVVMQQNGIFRVNCVDCLDRTNVVQSFLAKEVLGHQLSKVGLLMPEIGLSDMIKKKFLEVWANNGDIISKQYAGTNALKGDFTRTGERRFAGVMRDGMNSANRYLNNRLKDGTRQACIDLILGVRSSVSEEELTLGKEAVEEKEITTDLVMQMIDDVKHCVVPVQSVVIGTWGLVNAKTNEAGAIDIDTVLALTESDCYIAIYDCSLDTIARSTTISLNSVTSLEILSEPLSQSNVTSVWGLFQSSSSSASHAYVPSLKMYFTAEDEVKDFFHFRSSNISFFNNCPTPIGHPEEMLEALKMLAETIKAAAFAGGNKSIQVTHSASPGKPNQRGLPGINAWIPRWNAPTAQGATVESTSRKFNPSSMQRFTPGFLKKKRNNASAAEEEDNGKIEALELISSTLGDPSVPQSLKIPDSLFTSNNAASNPTTNAQQFARTPVGTGTVVNDELLDASLPSCGLIFLHGRNVASPQEGLLTGYLSDDLKVTPGISPVTPVIDIASHDVTPTSTDTNASMRLHIPPDLLQRHRFSLPTNSLGISLVSPSKLIERSTTPEIRITGEPQNLTVMVGENPGVSSAQKRMSRSSEDVNKVTAITAGVKMFNTAFINKVPVSLKNKLVPSHPQDSRSTSDQDIFSSLANMKGSHSENAIKDGNPAQKKDVVFAPLGKLARGMQTIGVNYLDPRKLRDSLRQPRQDNPPQDDPEIIEKMKTCKSQIIDV